MMARGKSTGCRLLYCPRLVDEPDPCFFVGETMSIKRNVYLQIQTVAQALQAIHGALDAAGGAAALVGQTSCPAHEACGRVLCAPVYARCSSPTTHAAAMDGYAVRASQTFAAQEDCPLTLQAGRDCFAVNTGRPLPEDCDAVIMIENTCAVGEDGIQIEAPAFPWQHVRRIGEDIVATELLFARNRRLSPSDVGALLSGGIWDVPVWEQIRVRIIPTGDEIVDFTTRPDPARGQVVESNSQMLAALVREMGCCAERVPPVPDDPQSLHRALCESLDSGAHVTLFCAGSSAGSKDFTRATLEKEGQVLVHGINVMPGKPSLAALCRGKLVFGTPGYPVSCLVCFEELVRPVLHWLAHTTPTAPQLLPVELMRAVPSRAGMEELVRLAVGRVGDKAVGIPLGRGAGNITTVTRSQAVARIPAAVEGWAQGQVVDAALCVSPEVLESMLVVVGSHDNTLDTLADALMGTEKPFSLVSTHVGSMGGITALSKGSCHMAGMHLLEEDSGDFNFAFLDKFLPAVPVTLINLAIRHQGLIVPKGNPKGITGVHDLAQQRLRFINRQRGAGTRILFDYHLRLAGMRPAEVAGYDKEENTHMAVAVNVLTGAADCGMGIFAAAKALDLDFVPLARERYDLAIPTQFLEDPRIIAVRELLANTAFTARIRALGGYDTTLTGQVMRRGIKLGE